MNIINQHNKQLVWRYWQGMNDAIDADLIFTAFDPNVIWHGFQPLRHLHGTAEIWEQ